MEITLLIIIALLGAIIFFFKQNSSNNHKSKIVKKSEIEQNYINMIIELNNKYQDNRTLLIEEKTKLIKQINDELSRNIFFTPQESKELIKKLLNL